MPTITILDTDQVTLWVHPEKKIVHHQMHKYTHGKDFRDVMTAGIEAMKKYRAIKWLSDDRLNPVLKPEDLEWSNLEWSPKVMLAGWKYWAIVQPESLVAQIRMDKLAKAYAEQGVTVKFFHDPDEAMKWLEVQ